MNLLKNISRKQRITIFVMILTIVSTLWIWERYEAYLERVRYSHAYYRLYKENQLLKYEIDNLQQQNQSLMKILELKQNLK